MEENGKIVPAEVRDGTGAPLCSTSFGELVINHICHYYV